MILRKLSFSIACRTTQPFATKSTKHGWCKCGFPKACPGPIVHTSKGTPSWSRPFTSTSPLCIKKTCVLMSPRLSIMAPSSNSLVTTCRMSSCLFSAVTSWNIWSTMVFCRWRMNNRGNIPSKQPVMIPIVLAAIMRDFTVLRCLCAAVKRGLGNPSLSAKRSMMPCRVMPNPSDAHWPSPAAANVVNPNVSPKVSSIVSPTVNMITLSQKPKPTNGTAL
mmetsp:Transcript_37672/g.100231  ORF Transcript_37672/g.100231 Transcript_37672/m.100231 type:complete len:220 (-) Transcript_37672:365-1024(-)